MGLWKKFKEKLKSAFGRKAKEKVIEEIVMPEKPEPVRIIEAPPTQEVIIRKKHADELNELFLKKEKLERIADEEYAKKAEFKMKKDHKGVLVQNRKIEDLNNGLLKIRQQIKNKR